MDLLCLCQWIRERAGVRVAAAPSLLCGDPQLARWGWGKEGWGRVWSGGRSGACEEGAPGWCLGVGNHSIPGMAARSPLITQPKGAMWTCQSRPERWHGKPQKGSVCLGPDQKTASGAAMPGLREPGLGALAACLCVDGGGFQHRPPGCSPRWRERSVRASPHARCQTEVFGASEVQDARSRNSSEPAALVLSGLVLWAPQGRLISFFPWPLRQESLPW